jgi:uncharacterized protein YndB with AHSA1/START domain
MPVSDRSATKLEIRSDTEIVITRDFDAPRELVFEVMTAPEHVRRWWGLRDHTMVTCEIDLRPGGAWHYVVRDPKGDEFGFFGTYREIVPPERIVATEAFDAPFIRDHPSVSTVTLTERDGWTTFTNHVVYEAKEFRDGHINSGMEAGLRVTLDRLAELLEGLR